MKIEHPLWTPLISAGLAVFSLAMASNSGSRFAMVMMLVFSALLVWSLARIRQGRPVPNVYAPVLRWVVRAQGETSTSSSMIWTRDRQIAAEIEREWPRLAKGWGASWRVDQDARGRIERLRDPFGVPRMEAVDAVPELRNPRSMNKGLAFDFRVPDGHTVADFQRRADVLASMVGHSVEVSQRGVGNVRVIVKTGADLLASPVTTVPGQHMAITEDGTGYTPAKAHTLVAGATGAGKASMAWNALFAWMRQEPVIVYGADPKASEFPFVRRTFEDVGTDPDGIARVLATVHSIIAAREELGRSFTATEEHPRIVLMIDEFPSLFLGMETKLKKVAEGDLVGILQKGRSRGVVVIAQTQVVTKEVVNSRDAFSVRLAGRLETASDTSLLFGPSAAERGITPELIPPANDSNGYGSAGIFYAVDETGQAHRCRCAYVSDDDLEQAADAIASSRGRVRRETKDDDVMPSAVRSRDSQERGQDGDTTPRVS